MDKQFLYTGRGQTFFLYTGLEQIFFMLSVMIVNVSEANILSSEARRPPPGPRNLLERGVGHQAKQKTGNLSKPQPNLNLRLGLIADHTTTPPTHTQTLLLLDIKVLVV